MIQQDVRAYSTRALFIVDLLPPLIFGTCGAFIRYPQHATRTTMPHLHGPSTLKFDMFSPQMQTIW